MGRKLTRSGLYNKGARKERILVNQARDNGCIAFRSAGSHSPIDVCIIDIPNRKIDFIQCKPDNFSEKEKERLEKELIGLNSVFQASFKVL